MNRRAWILIACIATILVMPAVAAVNTAATAGSTVFLNITDTDPNLAALVGLAKYQVTWFNGAVLYNRNVPSGERTVYAVAQGAPTPVGQTLTNTGTTYPFTDPSGVAWTITEKTYAVSGTTYYAYATAVGATTNGAATGVPSGGLYNFVLLVNTDASHLGTTNVAVYIGP